MSPYVSKGSFALGDDMDISVNKENNLYVFDITVPKGVVDREMDALAQQMQPKVRIKGFREGKAPLNVIRIQYADVLKGDVSTKLLYAGVEEAMREHKIKNAANPVLTEEFRPTERKKHVGRMNLDGSLTFKVTVEAPPEVDIVDYTGVEVDVDLKSFEDWAKQEIHKQQMVFGEKVVVERAAQQSDEVNVYFKGVVDGEQFVEEDDFSFAIGEKMFVDGFEESFVGRSAGDEFDIKITFPDNYGDPKLNGKDVLFSTKIHEVLEARPHPFDDVLAQMLSHESADAMWENYRTMWETEFEKPLQAQIFNAIMDKVIVKNPFDVPEAWIVKEMSLTAQRLGLKEFPTDPTMIESIRAMSERGVRVSFLLDKVYEKETGIHISADEIEAAATKDGAQHGLSGLEWLDAIRKQGQYEPYIAFQEQQKAVQFLIDSAILNGEKNDD